MLPGGAAMGRFKPTPCRARVFTSGVRADIPPRHHEELGRCLLRALIVGDRQTQRAVSRVTRKLD
jgi:hypothetical protein